MGVKSCISQPWPTVMKPYDMRRPLEIEMNVNSMYMFLPKELQHPLGGVGWLLACFSLGLLSGADAALRTIWPACASCKSPFRDEKSWS